MAYTTTDADQSGYSAMRVQPPAGQLDGLESIAAYAGVSKNTLKGLIKNEKFPAGKIGGKWGSTEGAIDNWRFKRMQSA